MKTSPTLLFALAALLVSCRPQALSIRSDIAASAVSGIVLDSKGAPVRGATVASIDPVSYSRFEVTTSDSAGRFTVSTQAGGTLVTATAPGTVAGFIVRSPLDRSDLTVRMGALSPTARRVRGTVLHAGAPLRGAWVRIARWDELSGETYYTTTNDAGGFDVLLPESLNFDVSVDDPTYASSFSAPQPGVLENIALEAIERNVLTTTTEPRTTSLLREACLSPTADTAAHQFEGARIIGLGEATHGTSEFTTWRSKLLVHLATTEVLSGIALEAGLAESVAADRFVRYGEGTALAATKQLRYWMWKTEEFVAFLEALKVANERLPVDRRVSIRGIDVDSPEKAVKFAREALRGSVVLTPALELHFDAVAAWPEWRTATSAEHVNAALAAFEGARRGLATPKPAPAVNDIAALALDGLILPLRRVQQGDRSWSYRDRVMAESLLTWSRSSQRTLALWAHDNHIARGQMEGIKPLGAYLRELLGDDYHAVGTLLFKGTFKTVRLGGAGLVNYAAPPPPAHYVEAILAEASGFRDCFLPLRRIAASAVGAEWLRRVRPLRTYGAIEINERYPWPPARLDETWDSVMFFADTTAITPLPE
jgi:erythromycin esterase